MSRTLTIQARIDAEVKELFMVRCAQHGVTQTTVIDAGIRAFIQHGKWWEEDDDEDVASD